MKAARYNKGDFERALVFTVNSLYYMSADSEGPHVNLLRARIHSDTLLNV